MIHLLWKNAFLCERKVGDDNMLEKMDPFCCSCWDANMCGFGAEKLLAIISETDQCMRGWFSLDSFANWARRSSFFESIPEVVGPWGELAGFFWMEGFDCWHFGAQVFPRKWLDCLIAIAFALIYWRLGGPIVNGGINCFSCRSMYSIFDEITFWWMCILTFWKPCWYLMDHKNVGTSFTSNAALLGSSLSTYFFPLSRQKCKRLRTRPYLGGKSCGPPANLNEPVIVRQAVPRGGERASNKKKKKKKESWGSLSFRSLGFPAPTEVFFVLNEWAKWSWCALLLAHAEYRW